MAERRDRRPLPHVDRRRGRRPQCSYRTCPTAIPCRAAMVQGDSPRARAAAMARASVGGRDDSNARVGGGVIATVGALARSTRVAR